MMPPSAPLARLGREHVPEAEALRWFFSDLLQEDKAAEVRSKAQAACGDPVSEAEATPAVSVCKKERKSWSDDAVGGV